jgi:hypothetical protein
MKPYGSEEDLSYIPSEKIHHPHKWEREERRVERRREKKRARRLAKEQIQEVLENTILDQE